MTGAFLVLTTTFGFSSDSDSSELDYLTIFLAAFIAFLDLGISIISYYEDSSEDSWSLAIFFGFIAGLGLGACLGLFPLAFLTTGFYYSDYY